MLPSPPLYDWLASLSAAQAGIVAQYPIGAADQATVPRYSFYGYAVHHRPLFNGVPVNTPADSLRLNLEDLLNPTMPASWAATSYYRRSFSNAGLRWDDGTGALGVQLPTGLARRYSDASSVGYAVTVAPANVLAGMGGGRDWRWTGGRGILWIDNATSHPVPTVLWTLAHNNSSPHSIAWPGYLAAPVAQARKESSVAIAVEAEPGFHPLTLDVEGAALPLHGSADSAPISVQLRSIEPAPIRPIGAAFKQQRRVCWRLAGVSTDGDQTAFVHLVTPDGRLVAQDDARPNGGTLASSRSTANTRIADAHSIDLGSSLSPGIYRLQAGLYDSRTGVRVRLTDGGTR